MSAYSAAANNVAVTYHEDDEGEKQQLVFTTGDRAAAELLGKICDEANITDTPEEFHYQGVVTLNPEER